jgi:predicted DNA-binding protein with PD1-like motif
LSIEKRRLTVKASEGKLGRVFIVRLEDGDVIPDCIERFAAKKKISVGQVLLIGGIHNGQIVSGPRHTHEIPPDPMLIPLDGVHEVVGIGLLTPDGKGKPVLHIHAALGRAGRTITGCLRPGVSTWTIGEAIISEILVPGVLRLTDRETHFDLLEIG